MVAIEEGATYTLEEFVQCHLAKLGLVSWGTCVRKYVYDILVFPYLPIVHSYIQYTHI